MAEPSVGLRRCCASGDACPELPLPRRDLRFYRGHGPNRLPMDHQRSSNGPNLLATLGIYLNNWTSHQRSGVEDFLQGTLPSLRRKKKYTWLRSGILGFRSHGPCICTAQGHPHSPSLSSPFPRVPVRVMHAPRCTMCTQMYSTGPHLQVSPVLQLPPPPALLYLPRQRQSILAAQRRRRRLPIHPPGLLEQLPPKLVRQPHDARADRGPVASVLALAPARRDLLSEVPQSA
jgi:hypothetical protein